MFRALIHYLFGVDAAPWTQGGQIRFEWTNLPQHDYALLLLAATCLAAVGIWWLYRRDGKTLSRPARLGLCSLRILALLGVLAMLLEPALVFVKREMLPSRLVVLVDDSQSMDVKDAYVDGARAQKIAAAMRLASPDALRQSTRLALGQLALDQISARLADNGDRIVVRHDFAGQLFPTAPSSPPQSPPGAPPSPPAVDRSSTGIGTAVRQALAAYRGQPIAGILLLTDGQSNTGDPIDKAAEAAAAEDVPLVSLALGTAEGPRSIKLTKIDVNAKILVRDLSHADVLIESRGMAGQPATVVLEKQPEGGVWEQIGRQQIVLAEAGTLQRVTFDFKEDRPTALALRARLEGVPANLVPEPAKASVTAVRDKISVLFIAGHPFPEFEFIRNALLRDTGLAAATWLQSADKDYDQPGSPPLKRLPATAEELDTFDCVIMYDPDPSLWPDNFPQLLTDFIGKQGGGLIYIAGERFTKDFFDHPDDPNSAWLPLLPVVSEPGLYATDATVQLSAKTAWKLEITPEGHASPVLQFAEKPEENDRILAALPGMFWHYPVTRAKAGATVLARHADPRMRNEYGNHVLLATQLVGPGRTFWVGFDSTYRWRFLDEQTFDGFWARMINRAGNSKRLGQYPFALTTDRTSYQPGSQVTLTARFENASDKDSGLDVLHGEVETPDGPMPITLIPRKGEPGTFDATFTVAKAGDHIVNVWTGEADAKQLVKAARLPVHVELPNLEFDQPTLNLAVLQTLAKVTGGAVFDLSQVDQVPGAFKVSRVARVLEDRQAIFNAPILFGCVLLCLFLEWILRKKFRLV